MTLLPSKHDWQLPPEPGDWSHGEAPSKKCQGDVLDHESVYDCPNSSIPSSFRRMSVIIVQLLSSVWLFVTSWTIACQAFPVPLCLLKFAQVNVHWIDDALLSSHLLLPSSPLAFNLSQCQGLFQRVGSSHQVAKVWELKIQYPFFQWIFIADFS